MIFVDTSAWFTAFVPNDRHHVAASAWWLGQSEDLLTTDYVVDELLTLLKVRGEFVRAISLGETLFAEKVCRLQWISPEIAEEAWEIFQKYDDKGWSFTDCVSRVVMRELKIDTAFAFDIHFRQFGDITIVP